MTDDRLIYRTFDVTEIKIETDDLTAWLMSQSAADTLVLAHALDGVIWGAVTPEWIVTSHDVAPNVSPPLRAETLQQLRLFNAVFEVRLTRFDDGFAAVKITDVEDVNRAAFDVQHLMWGTYAHELDHGFMLLEDGAQGLMHVLPPFAGDDRLSGFLGSRSDGLLNRACLNMRHYFVENDMGVNTIGMSRLTGLGAQTYGKE